MTKNTMAVLSAFLIVAGAASFESNPFIGVFAIIVGCLGVWNIFKG